LKTADFKVFEFKIAWIES